MSRRIGQDLFEVKLSTELVSRGLVKQPTLEEALRQQVVLGGHLATNLWEMRLVDGKTLTDLSAELLGVPVADPKTVSEAPSEVRRVFTREFVEHTRILPFRILGSVLQVATSEPWDMLTLGRAAYHGGYPVEPYFLAEVPLAALMDKLYEIPTSARFWLGVESNEKRPRGKSETAQVAEDLQAMGGTKPKSLLMSFVSAEVQKIKSGRVRPKGLSSRLIVQPLKEEEAILPSDALLDPLVELADAQKSLDAAQSRDEVAETLLRFALSRGKRVAAFVRRQNLWAGWMGGGRGVQQARVKSLLIPHLPDTVFGLVAQTGGHYLGPLAPHVAYAPLLLALGGGGLPRSVAVLPVHTHGRLVFAIYIDSGPERFVSTDIGDIVVLAQRVPQALERIVKARVVS